MNLITSLLPYQQEGVNKLKRKTVGALLMEMGTGKTRTALEFIHIRLEEHKVKQVLWLCPCSVKTNLEADLIKHCGSKPAEVKIEGIESISSSDRIYLENFEYVKSKPTYLIVDESSLVKNPKAKRSKRIETMSQECKYKLILNGTPISRNEADLYEQFLILDWRILGYRSYYNFAANHLVFREVKDAYGRIRQTDQVVKVLDKEYLAERIAPYSYQVKKTDVLKLKDKQYDRYYFDMTYDQQYLYNETKYLFLGQVDDFDSTTIYRLFTALQHITSGREITSGLDCPMETTDIFSDWEDNPRVQELRKCIADIPGSEQVIIFTKFDREVEEISLLLESEHKTYAIYTGKIRPKQREQELQRFRNGSAQYLLSNKSAGAYGLNLQFCHNIIFYNNDFDFGTRSQAEDRIHRIGQTDNCIIYDIICSGTIDQMITDNLDNKEGLLKALKEEIKKMREGVKHHVENISKAKRIRSCSGTNGIHIQQLRTRTRSVLGREGQLSAA